MSTQALTEVRGLTIDAKHTRDIDDAIWITPQGSGFQVDVSIADVASAVEPGSENDTRAFVATATKYFARGNSPMLPRKLSEDQLSLLPQQQRSTVTVSLVLDESFRVISGGIASTVLRSEGRISYEEIPAILGNPKDPFHSQIEMASRIAMGLLSHRRRAGAFALYDLNTGWVTTEEGYLRQLASHEETIGHILVQELMVLANSFVAAFAVTNDIPVPFRNHKARLAAPNRNELMLVISDALVSPNAQLEQIRQQTHMLLSKATYGSRLEGHYGLNEPAYLHFTSPIRRYADLVTHRQIKAFLGGHPFPYALEDIEVIALHLNEVARLERESVKQHMKDQADKKAHATIEARKIEGLNGKDFERVIKVWARSTNEVPAAIRQAYLVRIGDNRVPLVCFSTILIEAQTHLGWGEIKQATLQRLVAKPEDAMSVFNMAATTGQWPQPTYQSNRIGPDHGPIFQVEATLLLGDAQHVSGLIEGQTQKEAKQRAILNILASVAGLEKPQEILSETKAASGPPSAGPVIDWSKDAISSLLEYCTLMGQPAPVYQYKTSGPSHLPTFECICTVRSIVKTATGRTKQDAKRQASHAVLSQLGSR